MPVLGDEVADHADRQDTSQDIQLDAGAEECGVGEGYYEPQRLPHPVVGERRLRLLVEYGSVQSCTKEYEVKQFEYSKSA